MYNPDPEPQREQGRTEHCEAQETIRLGLAAYDISREREVRSSPLCGKAQSRSEGWISLPLAWAVSSRPSLWNCQCCSRRGRVQGGAGRLRLREDFLRSLGAGECQEERLRHTEVQISETETPLHRLETVYRRAMSNFPRDCFWAPSAPSSTAGSNGLEEDVLAEGTIDPSDDAALARRADNCWNSDCSDYPSHPTVAAPAHVPSRSATEQHATPKGWRVAGRPAPCCRSIKRASRHQGTWTTSLP